MPFRPGIANFLADFPRIPSLTAAELITVRPRAFPATPTAFLAPALAGPGGRGPAGTDQGLST
jgi:hypothetical protein